MISLPTDLLPFIFSFLSSKELCCLDSAILNHADRPVFLSALIQRFAKESLFNGEDNASVELVTRWYLCRRIPITDLTLDNVPYPKGLNFIYLKSILLYEINLHDEDLLVISQCSNLKKLDICGCSFPPHFDISSLLEGLSSLEQLELDYVPFSTLTVEIICRHCQSLKSLELSSLDSVGDDELRLLLEGCPSLHSLRLLSLPISQESVIMLRNCQILSIGIRYCEGVSLESVLSLLREVTIPTIFNSDATQELQISALGALHFSIPYTPQFEIPQISEFLTHESLLKRLVELLAHKNRFRNTLIDFLNHIARSGYHRLVVAAGVVPVLVRHFESFRENEEELRFAFLLLQLLSFKSIYQQHLLTSGVLSIFRLHRSQSESHRGEILFSLSSLISQSVVPIEDWISTISSLIRWSSHDFQEADLHLTIHSICMACSSPSHVRSLVGEGILSYWERVLGFNIEEGDDEGDEEEDEECEELCEKVREAISHLTSIDSELSSKVETLTLHCPSG